MRRREIESDWSKHFGLRSVRSHGAKGDGTMKYLVLIAIAVGVAAMPAEAAKKIHKSHEAYEARGFVLSNPDPSGGNAAAAGNNANSMSGNHSAGSAAIGRTNAP